jgi:cytoskeletal protein CcmA (bactofilin family)
MFFRNRNKVASRIDTLIGAETRVDGDMHFSGGLRVDGTIRGNVTESVPSTLVLSEHGCIEGMVKVSQVVLNGKVVGPVNALQFVELQAKSRVTGDVSYKTLEMHTGSVVEGKLVYMGDRTDEATLDPLMASRN